jgi:hypothetical protein
MIDLKPINNHKYSIIVIARRNKAVFELKTLKKDKNHLFGEFKFDNVFQTLNINNEHRIYTLSLGDSPYLTNSKRAYKGNYMIPHNYLIYFDVTVTNSWKLMFVPRAGVANGVFKINNKIYFGSNNQPLIYNISEEDIQNKRLEIETFPLVGSNYPVSLVLTKE